MSIEFAPDPQVRRLPTFMSVKAAAAELNQSVRQTYDDIDAGRLDSIVDPVLRKRHVLGASVEQRAAEKIAASSTSRRLNSPKRQTSDRGETRGVGSSP